VSEPRDDDIRTRPGIGWAFWIAGGVGIIFVIIYAIGGCLMQTIC
jgi:hypothetical protein